MVGCITVLWFGVCSAGSRVFKKKEIEKSHTRETWVRRNYAEPNIECNIQVSPSGAVSCMQNTSDIATTYHIVNWKSIKAYKILFLPFSPQAYSDTTFETVNSPNTSHKSSWLICSLWSVEKLHSTILDYSMERNNLLISISFQWRWDERKETKITNCIELSIITLKIDELNDLNENNLWINRRKLSWKKNQKKTTQLFWMLSNPLKSNIWHVWHGATNEPKRNALPS